MVSPTSPNTSAPGSGKRHDFGWPCRGLVQGAGAVTLQIDRDVLEASSAKLSYDDLTKVSFKQPRNLLRCHFDPRNYVVIPHATDLEPLGVQRPLATPHLRQSFRRDLRAIREPGLFHTGNPIRRAASRTSSFVNPNSSSGERTPRSSAAFRPGR